MFTLYCQNFMCGKPIPTYSLNHPDTKAYSEDDLCASCQRDMYEDMAHQLNLEAQEVNTKFDELLTSAGDWRISFNALAIR